MDASQTLSGGDTMCSFEPELKKMLTKFRFRKEKTTAAIMIKIDSKTEMVVVDDDWDDVTMEELSEALPPSQPRYIVYSHVRHHSDGRVSYPLCILYYCPTCKPGLGMRYAGMMSEMTNVSKINKVFKLTDADELTDEWLEGNL